MRDSIRDIIISRIVDGTYVAGERLIEMKLAHEFNVSQAPVREALRELEASGLVESRRYRGTWVRSPDVSELRDFYEMRALLEERSAQMIVPCPPKVLTDLENALSKMRKAAAIVSATAYAKESLRFHRRIVEAAGNRIFLQAWDNLQPEVRAHVGALHVQNKLLEYADAHGYILQALREGDGQKTGRMLRELIEHYVKNLQLE
jgi:DNA-binding GntR family transcriptional regulator